MEWWSIGVLEDWLLLRKVRFAVEQSATRVVLRCQMLYVWFDGTTKSATNAEVHMSLERRTAELKRDVPHFVPLHQGGRVPLPTSNGTQGVMVFSCQIKVRSTQQLTISKSAKRLLPLYPPQRGGQKPPCIPLSEPAVRKHVVRAAGRGDSLPLYSPQRRGQESTPLAFCRTYRSGRLPDRE
jgi:hypothetical protein